MSTFDKLLAAEYKGISFLVDSEETSEGRKIAIHDYVNNSRRFVEDLGELPSTFSVDAFVHGDDAIQQSQDLRGVLRESTQGSLTLPHLGTFEVKPGPFTVKTTMSQVGRIDFKLTFYLSEAGIFPISQENTAANLGAQADATREGLEDNLGENLNVPESAATQALTEGKVLEAADVWDSIVATASGPTELLASVGQAIGEIRNTISTLVRAPELLAAKMTDIYNNFSALTVQLDNLSLGLGFGDGDEPTPTTTPDRTKREENRVLLNDFIKVNTLISIYEQSITVEFETTDSLANLLAQLQAAYDQVRESNIILLEPPVPGDIEQTNFTDSSIDTSVSTTVVDNFNSIRDIGTRILESKEQSTSQVTEVEVNNTSISLLTYQLYGDLSKVDSIARLNLDQNLANMSVTAKVLSE